MVIFFHDQQQIYTSMIWRVFDFFIILIILSEIVDAFKNFAKLVSKYPDICERAHFIFVPGPQDRHAPKIYPRFVQFSSYKIN